MGGRPISLAMDAMDAFRSMPRGSGGFWSRSERGASEYETDPETRAWLERPVYTRGAGFVRAIIFLTMGICAVQIARIALTVI